jgi:hypothetical protein
MASYTVMLPISGKLFVEVEADSEDAAIEAAMQSTLTLDLVEEWEAHREVLRGNVFYGIAREAYAEQN